MDKLQLSTSSRSSSAKNTQRSFQFPSGGPLQKVNTFNTLPSTTRANVKRGDELEVLRKSIQTRQAYELESNSIVDPSFNSIKIEARKTIESKPKSRQEQIQSFIFAKKSFNKVRYNEKSKININAMPVHRGTISLMLNMSEKEEINAFTNLRMKTSSKTRTKLKWKLIQWLMENKKDAVEQLCAQYHFIIKVFNSKNLALEGIDREQFADLLSYIGLSSEASLAEKFFFVFDYDGNGLVDFKELIVGMETFKENTYEEKIHVYLSLCDTEGPHSVNKNELYDILKRNCIHEDEKIAVKKALNKVFAEANSQLGRLKKNTFFEFAQRSQELKTIVEQTARSVKKIDKMMEQGIDEPATWVPLSGNLMNSKEGVHFPIIKNLMSAVAEQEEIKFSTKKLKQTLNEKLRLAKSIDGRQFTESEDEL